MQFIDCGQQEAVILSFEKDFSSLISNVNMRMISSHYAKIQALELLSQLRKVNKSSYFDEYSAEHLQTLDKTISDYIKQLMQQDAAMVIPYKKPTTVKHLQPLAA